MSTYIIGRKENNLRYKNWQPKKIYKPSPVSHW